MIKNWIFYIILLFSCLFYSLYDGAPTSLFLLKILIIAPIFSFIFVLICSFSVKVNQTIEKQSFIKMENIKIKFNIKNKGILFIPLIKINFSVNKLAFNPSIGDYILSLNPLSQETCEISAQCKLLGSYEIAIKRLYFYDLLGLFRLSRSTNQTFPIIIFPRVINLSSINLHQNQPFHNLSDQLDSHYDIRNYRQGDTMRLVHWKVSAKKNQLMVKNIQMENEASLFILLDLYHKPFSNEHPLIIKDRLIECAVSIANHCLSQGIKFKLLYYNDETSRIHNNVNHQNFDEFINILTSLELNSKINITSFFSKIEELDSIIDLVILTAEPVNQYQKSVDIATQQGVNTFIYNLDHELLYVNEEVEEIIC